MIWQHALAVTPSLLCPQVLQHEIRKTHARNQKVEWVDDLVLMETIGKGGFGVVYKGSWKGSLAAIKVRNDLCFIVLETLLLQNCSCLFVMCSA